MRATCVRILAFVLLGVATTVAVAWCGASMTNRFNAYARHNERAKVYFLEDDWHSAVIVDGFLGEFVHLNYIGGDVLHDPHLTPRDLPGWTITHRKPESVYPGIVLDRAFQEEAWGWPMRALSSAALIKETSWPRTQPETVGGVYLGWEQVTGAVQNDPFVRGFVRLLPLSPILVGLAVDSILYGGVWMLMFVSFRSARRQIRMRLGRCPKCNYDLRHRHIAGCPECGWNR